VISGDDRSIEAALTAAQAAGAKRALKLAVSIAAHSPLMESASAHFRRALEAVSFHRPHVPVYANIHAQPLTTAAAIRQELEQQLTHSVLWSDSVRAMTAAGASTFVEVGPKDVLAGLIKRIDRDTTRFTLNNLENLQAFITAANAG
jgi:[acyl-carrier-protein] S-malonyltransferase